MEYRKSSRVSLKAHPEFNLSSAKLVRNPDTVDGVQGGREVVG